ncbi:phage tail protein [Bosea vestrisii]|uniref:Phage tail protein n=1 Tax=Bosea vestrisii TaxID=151416 RepID=A0ABW0H763_9HYPH
MSDYVGTVTNIGLAKIAAAIGGTALNLAIIRVGDGNGAPITPNPTMTDLVRRVGAAYPIISSGRDPVNANFWRVTALVPVEDGPFDIREIGVWDAAGDMIAISRHVLVEKRSPAQGAAVELLTDIVFPVAETAQVTVQVHPSSSTSILQVLRAGFTVVESAVVTAPPGAPALGRTHVIPAGATGAWAGLAGYLAQWNGTVWVTVDVPAGFVVVAMDRAADHAQRWLRRTAAGWVGATAAEDAFGVARFATLAEHAAGASNALAAHPAGIRAMIDSFASRPNLLINGDFQLNQRGFAGGALASGAYGLDRWKANGASNLSVAGYVLTLTSGEIVQMVEPGLWGTASLASTTLTLSVDDPSQDLTVTIGSTVGAIAAGAGRRSVTLVTAAGDAGNLPVKIKRTAAGAVTFGRVKLEVGGSASAWRARPATEEALLAARYAWMIKPGSGSSRIAIAQLVDDGSVHFNIELPTPLRTNAPSVTVGGGGWYRGGVSSVLTTGVTAAGVHGNPTFGHTLLSVRFSSPTTSGAPYASSILSVDANSSLFIDAEI